jgi:hypothetical protein
VRYPFWVGILTVLTRQREASGEVLILSDYVRRD